MAVWVAAGGAVAALVYLLARPTRAGRALQHELDLPISPIAQLATGVHVHASGTVRAAQPLISPITRVPCAFYEARIFKIVMVPIQMDSRTDYIEKPELVDTHRVAIAFELVDASGTASIDPTGASLPIGDNGLPEQIAESGDETLAVHQEAYLETRGFSTAHGVRLRVRERVLAVGEQAHVFGSATRTATGVAFAHTAAAPLVIRDISSFVRL